MFMWHYGSFKDIVSIQCTVTDAFPLIRYFTLTQQNTMTTSHKSLLDWQKLKCLCVSSKSESKPVLCSRGVWSGGGGGGGVVTGDTIYDDSIFGLQLRDLHQQPANRSTNLEYIRPITALTTKTRSQSELCQEWLCKTTTGLPQHSPKSLYTQISLLWSHIYGLKVVIRGT